MMNRKNLLILVYSAHRNNANDLSLDVLKSWIGLIRKVRGSGGSVIEERQ